MPYAGDLSNFALFQQKLIGSWSNLPFPNAQNGEGGPANPLSYNVMPLPQDATQAIKSNAGVPIAYPGYILKNFTYYETIKFKSPYDLAIPAVAPNRGGKVEQLPHALFYDQRVKFAEGPNKGMAVHVENGTWLSLTRIKQPVGPNPPAPNPSSEQPNPRYTLVKQIAVPHGNSILALGSFDTAPRTGTPPIPNSADTFPSKFPHKIYDVDITAPTAGGYENPDTALTLNPNEQLQNAVQIIKPLHFIHWQVIANPNVPNKGDVRNIPFEKRKADVTYYSADYWLLSTDNSKNKAPADLDFNYLAYTQTMLMTLTVKRKQVVFPHVTCNTVTRQ